MEAPYIKNNIDFTRVAFGLNNIKTETYSAGPEPYL